MYFLQPLSSGQQNVSFLPQVFSKPLGDVRLQPIQHRNLTSFSPAPSAASPSQGEYSMSPLPWNRAHSSLSSYPQTHQGNFFSEPAKPVPISFDKPVSSVNDYLTSIQRKTCLSPSGLDELPLDENKHSLESVVLSPFNASKDHPPNNSHQLNLNSFKETSI